ncbi:MAG: hypothetical protein SR3Q1_00400 [Quinella sp. 3Q1]|nr:hypothetical protein [Quinella sp. 3Q1]MBR6888549.1 hypothetical protein [Selenomonadaceae bacterium]
MDGEKRYCTIEESLIEACKEVNLMRKGLLPEIDAREALAKLREELKNELEEEVFVSKKKVAARW